MNNDKNIDESLLIEGIREGEEFAFEYVFKLYYRRLCLFAQKYVRDSQTAEEVVSRVFKKLWEKRKTIHINESLASYLFQSVYHESLNHLNSFSQRQKPTDSVHSDLKDHRGTETSFLYRLYADELEEKIQQGINNLPSRCRDIFYMSRYKELSHKEIAKKLGLSVRTVENQIAIALEKLREMLKKEQNTDNTD